jgi:hypothetical protein
MTDWLKLLREKATGRGRTNITWGKITNELAKLTQPGSEERRAGFERILQVMKQNKQQTK